MVSYPGALCGGTGCCRVLIDMKEAACVLPLQRVERDFLVFFLQRETQREAEKLRKDLVGLLSSVDYHPHLSATDAIGLTPNDFFKRHKFPMSVYEILRVWLESRRGAPAVSVAQCMTWAALSSDKINCVCFIFSFTQIVT